MAIMHGRISHWPSHGREAGLTVYTDEVMAEWACTLPSDRRICMLLGRDRVLRLVGCTEGVLFSKTGPQTAKRGYEYEASTGRCIEKAQAFKSDIELPLFEMFEIDFKEVGAELHAILPPDHELPWPSARTMKHAADPAAMAKEALEIRVTSLVASGLTGFQTNQIPGHIRAYLPPAAFIEARRMAQTLAGFNG